MIIEGVTELQRTQKSIEKTISKFISTTKRSKSPQNNFVNSSGNQNLYITRVYLEQFSI